MHRGLQPAAAGFSPGHGHGDGYGYRVNIQIPNTRETTEAQRAQSLHREILLTGALESPEATLVRGQKSLAALRNTRREVGRTVADANF